MKFKLKTPILDDNNIFKNRLQQQIHQFPTQTTIHKDNENSLAVGIMASLAYYFFIFYMYGSSLYKNNINIKNPTYQKNFTMSEAFEGSERIGTTISIILMGSLFFTLLVEQGFATRSSSDTEISVIVTNFILLFSMLLLMVVGPTGSSVKIGFHVFLANLIIIFCVYNSFMIPTIYSEVYEDPMIDIIQIIGYVLTGLAFLILVFYTLLSWFRGKSNFSIQLVTTFITGISVLEIMFSLLFGSVFGMFGALPALIHQDKVCVAVLSNQR